MKDFLKFTLATVTGIVISSVVLFFISILVVFSMFHPRNRKRKYVRTPS